MNVSREAQAEVEAIRKLLTLTIPCEDEGCEKQPAKHYHPGRFTCSRHLDKSDPRYAECPCRGTNLELDPAYEGLRELCEETGQVTRDWMDSLSGSLYGATIERLEAPREDGEMQFEAIYPTIMKGYYRVVRLTHDRDLAITRAIREVLKTIAE